jgi:hypothetical protein
MTTELLNKNSFKLTQPRQLLYSFLLISLAYYLITDPAGSIATPFDWFRTAMFAIAALALGFVSFNRLNKAHDLMSKIFNLSASIAAVLFLLAATYNVFLLML